MAANSVDLLSDLLEHLFALVILGLVGGRQTQSLQATLDTCSLRLLVFSLLCCLFRLLGCLCLFLALTIAFGDHLLLLVF